MAIRTVLVRGGQCDAFYCLLMQEIRKVSVFSWQAGFLLDMDEPVFPATL
jgi:hypothetical protein